LKYGWKILDKHLKNKFEGFSKMGNEERRYFLSKNAIPEFKDPFLYKDIE
jgi:hypothetical protein